ncbi:MAG: hypothetical protein J7641_00540 [Cyanobacteria bacterium SID2]|nr:hypothetical protein [Cyanobacteria bacterium SID2]MBP0003654.1 hypothetical protein [Cyanobacteria bacterium SBC]
MERSSLASYIRSPTQPVTVLTRSRGNCASRVAGCGCLRCSIERHDGPVVREVGSLAPGAGSSIEGDTDGVSAFSRLACRGDDWEN